MKVLIAIPCLLAGGTEIQTLSLVEALVAAGHEVTTACYFEHNAAMTARYEAAGSRVFCLSADGSRPRSICRTVVMLLRGLRGVVRNVRPDVAHVQYMAPGAIPIIILWLLGIKVIVATAHTAADIYTPRGLQLLRWLTRHVLAAFTCITQRAEQSFFGPTQRYQPDMPLRRRGNHFTVYNSLPSYIQPLAHPRQPNEATVVGVVSRLEHIKGSDLVVPAFAEIHRSHPATRLLIVGDGSQRSLMERQVSEAGLTDCVEFTGRQPQESLQACYDRIDVLLMPSRSEGFGLTALEGMARGCVVVAADTGGLPEVIGAGSDGIAGLLHRPGDAADIAQQAHTLLSNPQQRQSLSAAAIRRATDFSRAEYQRLVASLYQQLETLCKR